MDCVFCGILDREEPASFVHEDEVCVGFLSLLQTRPGETVIIPRDHIDHFTDVPEDTAAHIMKVAHRLGRVIRERMSPQRIGYVVHGYGVPHANAGMQNLGMTSDDVYVGLMGLNLADRWWYMGLISRQESIASIVELEQLTNLSWMKAGNPFTTNLA